MNSRIFIYKTSIFYVVLSFILTLFVLAALSGCSMGRKTQQSYAQDVAASHAATIEKALDGQTIPNVSVSGSSNVVTVAPVPLRSTTEITDNANTKGAASEASRSSFRASISTWLAFALACFGVVAVLIGWFLFSRGTATGAAADRGLATAIDAVDHMAAAVVTEESALALARIKATLEKQRGKAKA